MAGYDLSFEIPPSHRSDVKQWLRFLQRTAAMYDVDVSYRTRRQLCDSIEVWVFFDGSLPALQYLDRRLPEMAVQFIRVVGKPETMMKKVLRPFFSAYKEGIAGITETVFTVANFFGGVPPNLTLSSRQLEEIQTQGHRSPEGRAVRTIVGVLDGWLSQGLDAESAVILCDQAMEDWLKARLRLPTSSRDGFPQVVDQALQSELISSIEADRLTKLHKTRNWVQHRGGHVETQTALTMFDDLLRFVQEHEDRNDNDK